VQQGTKSARGVLGKLMTETGLADLLCVDATQVALPRSAATTFPSTTPGRGGYKITAFLSLVFTQVTAISVTNAREHDRKALKLPKDIERAVIIADRGYADAKLFAEVTKRGGHLLTRLKKNFRPTVAAVRKGLDPAFVGQRIDPATPFEDEADLDADFGLPGAGTIRLRIVGLRLPEPSRRTGKTEYLLFVTDLGPSLFSVEQISTLYRMRWEIERLFRVLKSVGRLDQLKSAKQEVIECFMYATLIGIALACQTCVEMRRHQPHRAPGLHRVMTIILSYLPKIIREDGSPAGPRSIRRFETALWREGCNPNRSRPYTLPAYEEALLKETERPRAVA
jgi:hypothetical protein